VYTNLFPDTRVQLFIPPDTFNTTRRASEKYSTGCISQINYVHVEAVWRLTPPLGKYQKLRRLERIIFTLTNHNLPLKTQRTYKTHINT